jgi:hypothetical protein
MLASVESLLGSIAFAVALGLSGLIAGFIICRRGKAKD